VSAALARLLTRLALHDVGDGEFVDPGGDDALHRIFGGQIAAQALAAMGRTVPAGRPVHNLHVRFLRPARPARPLRFAVRAPKRGRAFDVRTVEVEQDGAVVLCASASFHAPEAGEPAWPAPATRFPVDPEELPRWEDRFAGHRDRLSPVWAQPRPVDLRFVDPPMLDPELPHRPRTQLQIFLRADGPLPDDQLVHACVLVYAADSTLLETTVLPLGLVWADGAFDGASLDHAMWFHRPPRADNWLYFDQRAEVLGGGRGTASGRMLDQDGAVVVTAVQEGSLRSTRGRGSWLARSASDRVVRAAT
jgi:acyl-CoA thioesterase-2